MSRQWRWKLPFYLVLVGLGLFAMPGPTLLLMLVLLLPYMLFLDSRRRGRIYLGPLAAVAADSSTGRPNTSFVTAIKNAAAAYLASVTTDGTFTWVVHSHTTGASPGTYDETGNSVTVNQGWVDNAWDTQRRRGMAPTTRSAFP